MVYIALLSAIVLIGLDQWTKWLVVDHFDHLGESFNVIKIGDTEILNITYHHNTGAAFGLFGGKTLILSIVVSLILIFALFLLFSGRIKKPLYIWAVSLIIAGGAGNLIDRIFNNGNVVDFINVEFINFPIFNVADICAVVGCFGLFFLIVFEDIKEAKQKRSEASKAELATEDTAEVVSEETEENAN